MNNFIFPFQKIKQDSKIILYGAGTIGLCFYKQLNNTGYADVVLWVDANYAEYQEKGYPVENPSAISDCKNFDYVVIANHKINVVEEITKMLEIIYGVDNKKIIFSDKYVFPEKGLFEKEKEDVYKTKEVVSEIFKDKQVNLDELTPEQKYDLKSTYNRRVQKGEKIKQICECEISVNDLFLAQYYHGDYSLYKHCDAAVRMFALEQYLDKNDFGLDLYRRMQSDSGFDWSERFRKLYDSVEENGFKDDSVLELDRNFAILDGSHRATLAMYKGQEFLKCKIFDCERNRIFDKNFFWERDFSEDECKLIERKTNEILDKMKYTYVGVLWPAAEDYFDDIINDLKVYDPENISVVKCEDMYLSKGDFEHIFRGLYHTDVLGEAGMQIKISQIENSMREPEGTYHIRVFYIDIKEPKIGVNIKNYTPQSQTVKQIKKVFRKRYENKILNYQYDVIMHISDNYLQSRFCEKLFKIDRNLSEYFGQIKDKEYISMRAKETRQHEEFPNTFYFKSNVNILMRNNAEMKQMAEITLKYCKEHFSSEEWIEFEYEEKEDAINVIVLMKDFAIFKFEFCIDIYGLNEQFKEECFEHRIFEDYYYLPVEDEIIIRIIEYIHKPKKVWYIPYIKKNIKFLDSERLYRSVDFDVVSKNQIENFLKGIEQQ